MNRKTTRMVHAGKYVAEVDIELIPDDEAWGPYVSLDDALKLERVQKALEFWRPQVGFRPGSGLCADSDRG